MIFGGEQAFLDRQFTDSQFQNFEVGNFVDHRRRGMIVAPVSRMVVAVVLCICHVLLLWLGRCFGQSAASSHMSGYSL